jgi:hypothetical protein
VFLYRIENVMGGFNYWTDLMTRLGVGWIASSENKAHGKMASLFPQPYISPPDYDSVDFPSKKEILLLQQSSVNEYERCQQSKATAGKEEPPQQVDVGGIRMMNNALWIPERAVELRLHLCVEAHCLSAGHRAYGATLKASRCTCPGQRWRRMSKSLCRIVCILWLLFLELEGHARWVRRYTKPSPTRSCTSTYSTLGCQKTGSINTFYFSRMT